MPAALLKGFDAPGPAQDTRTIQNGCYRKLEAGARNQINLWIFDSSLTIAKSSKPIRVYIPSFADWVKAIRPESWMGRALRLEEQLESARGSP